MALTDEQLLSITESPFKQDFPLLANNPGLTFLDSAATAQRPAVVLDAERRFYETMNANPLRGLYGLSVEATAAIEDARARRGEAPPPDSPAPQPSRPSRGRSAESRLEPDGWGHPCAPNPSERPAARQRAAETPSPRPVRTQRGRPANCRNAPSGQSVRLTTGFNQRRSSGPDASPGPDCHAFGSH